MTILEALNALQEPYRTQAIENTPELFKGPKPTYNNQVESISYAVANAFLWHESPQGHQYWENLCKALAIMGL
jgi:hypothetical protein